MADLKYMDGFDMQVFLPEDTGVSHTHRDVEILYGIEGTAVIKTGDASYRLEPEDVLLINAGKPHSIRKMAGRISSMLCCIHLSEKMLCEYTGKYRLLFWCNSAADRTPENYRELKRIIRSLLVDYMDGKAERYFLRYSQCYALLHQVVTYFLIPESGNGTEKQKKTDIMDERAEDILHYIEMYYDSDISLNELAEQFSLSVSYLSRYLKKKLGMNFTDYLYGVRMRYAVEDLIYTSSPVTKLALDHGFPSASVFNERFRKTYGCTPSEFRKKNTVPVKNRDTREKEETVIREKLKTHFGITLDSSPVMDGVQRTLIEADSENYREYRAGWDIAVNAGAAVTLKYADMRQALIYAQKELRIRYVRIWSLFDEEIHIIKDGKWGTNSFSRINEIIQFLLDHQLKPFIELGEKPRRILRSTDSFVRKPENRTNFRSYDQFLNCLKALMQNFTAQFGRREVESWIFEIWEDLRTEVYPDKVPYMILFRDCSDIIRREAPKVRIGGAGNHLGWYPEHTEQAVSKWGKANIYPDFLSFNYYPYTAGDQYQESFSKRKYDESDLFHTLQGLEQVMKRAAFPKRDIYITDWNMSVSSRNFFQDSLWKGCYVLKCYLESLGKADALIHGQLIDSTTDDVDSQMLINGSGGLLTRNMIEKPSFIAMKMLSLLKPNLVELGDGYIVTESEDREFSIILYNFINRNYLYYIKQEYENMPQDHYRYFENLDGRTFEVNLSHLPAEQEYIVRHAIVNREHGSVLDEWNSLSCIESPSRDDIEYLRETCRPKKTLTYMKADRGKIHLECTLRPLEMRLITMEKKRTPD